MKILFDANLSYRLVKKLAEIYPECLHVNRTGLPIPAIDRDIWDWGEKNDCIIVTNDEDFLNLSIQLGAPPKVVLLQIGNQSTTQIARILTERFEDIKALYLAEDYHVLEIF
ncbi:DUF5615 family PIN-like protein [Haliscomenobacter hydrossis]|uniref:DUF5615 domain-containing protein n=1 Tax=Haliscomenobacter hydrossis (strain ATCC 27775 / DSM 1100 / LMG 10767 / O) TaxID=760192 RepID=F4KT83_HALH1|nr:DUF5615 family PIN-like protein [Haliscomenobacter hydrossis]AEE51140.1 hypothetical protein Halhy_3281 [Haliscomenobacter hydrossis DSM 1100]